MDTRVRDRDGALSEDEQLGVVLVKSGIITIAQLGEALGPGQGARVATWPGC